VSGRAQHLPKQQVLVHGSNGAVKIWVVRSDACCRRAGGNGRSRRSREEERRRKHSGPRAEEIALCAPSRKRPHDQLWRGPVTGAVKKKPSRRGLTQRRRAAGGFDERPRTPGPDQTKTDALFPGQNRSRRVRVYCWAPRTFRGRGKKDIPKKRELVQDTRRLERNKKTNHTKTKKKKEKRKKKKKTNKKKKENKSTKGKHGLFSSSGDTVVHGVAASLSKTKD